MKIAVPTIGNKGMEEEVYGHFGSAPFFTIVDTETEAVEVIDNGNRHHDHGSCHPMMVLTGKEIAAVVTGGMGKRAIEILNAANVKVYLACGNTVGQVVKEFNSDRLTELTPNTACAGHGCH